ncbi:hypothetical protein KKI22_02885 [Patescibacteria group bacterium]|nr:hypothetical protein [Patescibacteria group bacterium]
MARSSAEFEKKFKKNARIAGFLVEEPRPIVADQAVEDRNGKIRKIKTLPDCFIIEPINRLSMHVEITNGSGNNNHKAAQQRVVKAAGIKNYMMLTGNQVEEFCEKETPADKRLFLLTIFGWLNLL